MDKIYELIKEIIKHKQTVNFPIDDSVVVIPGDKYGDFIDGLRKLSINSKPQAPKKESDNSSSKKDCFTDCNAMLSNKCVSEFKEHPDKCPDRKSSPS